MTGTSQLAFSARDIPTLVALLTEQRDCYRRLDGLSHQQSTLITDGQAEQLLGLLSQRQAIIDTLTQINSKLAPYREQWEVVRQMIPADQRNQVNGMLAEVENTLAAILKRDEQAQQQLQETKDRIGTQLRETTQTSSALNAYKVASPAAARFTDNQG